MLARKRSTVAAIAVSVVVGAGILFPSSASATATSIGSPISRPWLGYGINVEPEPGGGSSPGTYTDSMAVLDASRTADLSPQIVRDTWLTTGFDPTGAVGVYDWTTTWATNEFKELDSLKSQNIPVMIGWWSTPWDATSADHATVVADFLQYLIQTKGYTNIVAWDGMNEPNHRDPTTYARWKTEVSNIKQALTTRGLSTVGIVGPGTQDTSASTSWLNSASQEMSGTLSGYDIHYYPTGATDISGGSVAPWTLSLTNTLDTNDPSKKPVYVEEVGYKYGWDSANDSQPHVTDYSYGLNMAAMGIQLARGGASAPMAWRLADLGSPKVWGMYDGASSTTLRPWSYSWALLTKAFPRNSTLYKPVQPTSVFDMLGSTGSGASQKWSIAAVNFTSSSNSQTFQLANAAGKTFSVYTYLNGTLTTNADGFPSPSGTTTAASDGSVTVTTAANTMVVITNIAP